MKMFVVLIAFLAAASAAPQLRSQPRRFQSQQQQQVQQQVRVNRQFDVNDAIVEQPVVLVKETPLDNIGTGGYQYGYRLSNGESREETAEVVNEGQENQSLVVRGSYSYVDPVSGQEFTVEYVADENGYRPVGEHIPA